MDTLIERHIYHMRAAAACPTMGCDGAADGAHSVAHSVAHGANGRGERLKRLTQEARVFGLTLSMYPSCMCMYRYRCRYR